LIEMVEILKLAHYTWPDAQGRHVPQTQVTWRDAQGKVKVTVLKGTLTDREKITREVRARHG